ncbi:hypothetical protein M3Y97_00264300 [Aphelenchoides bicaudatus]|nr:hypothetical protein M3Y97_00264300 [Aphelenchoides bicaudatus]
MINIRVLSLLAVFVAVALAADEKAPDGAFLNDIRSLELFQFTSPDYPAAFAIVAGVTIILAIAITFIVVGLLTADPGKDSIIYRMTTTRMKKD